MKSKKSKKNKNKKNKNDKKKNTNKSKFSDSANNSDDVTVNQIYAFHVSADIASAKQKFQIDFEISEFIIFCKEHFIKYIKLSIFKSVIAANDNAMQIINIDMIQLNISLSNELKINIIIKNVLYMSKLATSLILVIKLTLSQKH